MSNVHVEPFPCVSIRQASVKLTVGGKVIPARAIAGAPGTELVETDLVWIEMPEQAERKVNRGLKGKVVALFGPLPTDAGWHRRLVAAKPAAVIHVDDRLPFDWVKDDGVYPTWTRRYGMPPTVTIPYRVAWELRKAGATRVRIRIDVKSSRGESQNVVAEIPGRRPELPAVLIGAHHDTQCNNVGADNNGSGVVAVLELADKLRHINPLRTVRFISFGTEEQLSVGSAAYVKKHRCELARIGVMLNIDSVASVLGHLTLWRAGTEKFGDWLVRRLAQAGLDARQDGVPIPFADHFPFSVFDLPAVTLIRTNMNSGMRWQHHSAFDNLDNVSVPEMRRFIDAVAVVAGELANATRWPFPRGLAAEQRAATVKMARDLFDLGI